MQFVILWACGELIWLGPPKKKKKYGAFPKRARRGRTDVKAIMTSTYNLQSARIHLPFFKSIFSDLHSVSQYLGFCSAFNL
jgi:hypothetical protein